MLIIAFVLITVPIYVGTIFLIKLYGSIKHMSTILDLVQTYANQITADANFVATDVTAIGTLLTTLEGELADATTPDQVKAILDPVQTALDEAVTSLGALVPPVPALPSHDVLPTPNTAQYGATINTVPPLHSTDYVVPGTIGNQPYKATIPQAPVSIGNPLVHNPSVDGTPKIGNPPVIDPPIVTFPANPPFANPPLVDPLANPPIVNPPLDNPIVVDPLVAH